MEFEWMLFSGFTSLQILFEILKLMTDLDCEPEPFQGRTIHVDVQRHRTGRSAQRTSMSCKLHLVVEYAKKFSLGHWSFLGPRSETKWNATDTFRPGGEWDRVAEVMMINFSVSGDPTFRATSALERGTLKSKGGGTLSMNFCGDYDNVELVFRTVVSVDQLSIYGAVAALCEEFTLP